MGAKMQGPENAFSEHIERVRRELSLATADPLVAQTLEELETSLEELRVAEEHIAERSEELRKSRTEVEAERHRYRELFDFAPEAYLVTDLDGVIVEANAAAGSLVGVRPRYLAGKPFALFVAERSRPLLRERLSRVHRQTTRRGWAIEMTARSGRVFSSWASVNVVRAADGRISGLRWLILERDRTSREERLQVLFRGLRGESVGARQPDSLALVADEIGVAVGRIAMATDSAARSDDADRRSAALAELAVSTKRLRMLAQSLKDLVARLPLAPK